MKIVALVIGWLVAFAIAAFVFTALASSVVLDAWDLVAGYGWWGVAIFLAWPVTIGAIALGPSLVQGVATLIDMFGSIDDDDFTEASPSSGGRAAPSGPA